MQIVQSLFGKHLDEITKEDLTNYFQEERTESDLIEYKSSSASSVQAIDKQLQDAIFPSVCAFLNSGGGIIVWGAPRSIKRAQNGEHVVQGELTPLSGLIAIDKFISSIVNTIMPSPMGVLINSIEIEEGKFVYMITIEKSLYPPHQYKYIYYARFNASTRMAPHHYVEALMKQIRQPDVRGYIKFTKPFAGSSHVCIRAVAYFYNLSRFIPAHNLQFSIVCSEGLYLEEQFDKPRQIPGKSSIEIAQGTDILHYNLCFDKKLVIYTSDTFGAKGVRKHFIELIFWCDNLSQKTSKYLISQQGTYRGYSELYPSPQYENKFMFELADDSGISDQERIQIEMESQVKNLDRFSFFKTSLIESLMRNAE